MQNLRLEALASSCICQDLYRCMSLVLRGRLAEVEGLSYVSIGGVKEAPETTKPARQGFVVSMHAKRPYTPRRIMSKNSDGFLVAFMFLIMGSIDSISSHVVHELAQDAGLLPGSRESSSNSSRRVPLLLKLDGREDALLVEAASSGAVRCCPCP